MQHHAGIIAVGNVREERAIQETKRANKVWKSQRLELVPRTRLADDIDGLHRCRLALPIYFKAVATRCSPCGVDAAWFEPHS